MAMAASFFARMADTHWAGALGDAERPRMNRAAHVVAPLTMGALALMPGRVWAHNLEILNGVAIITGLFFSLLVFLVQLRHQVRTGEAKAAAKQRDKTNLDNAFYSSTYAMVVGFLIITALILQSVCHVTLASWSPVGRILSNWVIFALFVHFLLTMWVCVRRLWRLYEVFGLNKS